MTFLACFVSRAEDLGSCVRKGPSSQAKLAFFLVSIFYIVNFSLLTFSFLVSLYINVLYKMLLWWVVHLLLLSPGEIVESGRRIPWNGGSTAPP